MMSTMGNSLRVCAVLAAAAMSAASATAPVKHQVNTADTVSASYDATWIAVIDLFAERNWPIKNMDKASGLITTDAMRIDVDGEAYADCGGVGMASPVGTTVQFNVRVKPNGDGTQVAVNAAFQSLRRDMNGGRFDVPCTSRGAVEDMIHREVGTRSGREEKRQAKTKATADAASKFFCTGAPADATIAGCARSHAGCEKRQADIVALAGDATPCAQQAGAVCFKRPGDGGMTVESCHPTKAACARPHSEAAYGAPADTVTACVDQ